MRNLSALALVLLTAAPALADFAGVGRFEGDLILKDVAAEYENAGAYDPGHTEFMLMADYAYVDASGEVWRAPAGTVVNGASIPSVAWSFVGGPWSGKYRNASVIHDWMCVERLVDGKTTHRIFYEAMRANGVDDRTALIMYEAVRRGGPQWELNSFGPSEVTRSELTSAQMRQIIKDARAGRISVD